LKLKYDEPLSSFAFKFNLRRFTKGEVTLRRAPRDFEMASGAWLCVPRYLALKAGPARYEYSS